MCIMFFFFKQKTAYEMRISDWSSDVCSSDLASVIPACSGGAVVRRLARNLSQPVPYRPHIFAGCIFARRDEMIVLSLQHRTKRVHKHTPRQFIFHQRQAGNGCAMAACMA